MRSVAVRRALAFVLVTGTTFVALVTLVAAARQPAPLAPAAAVAPTPKRAPVVGDTLRTTAAPAIFVNEGAYLMHRRADEERDGPGISWVERSYPNFWTPEGTPVRLLRAERSGAHVEMLGGKHAGRRGWVGWEHLAPHP